MNKKRVSNATKSCTHLLLYIIPNTNLFSENNVDPEFGRAGCLLLLMFGEDAFGGEATGREFPPALTF